MSREPRGTRGLPLCSEQDARVDVCHFCSSPNVLCHLPACAQGTVVCLHAHRYLPGDRYRTLGCVYRQFAAWLLDGRGRRQPDAATAVVPAEQTRSCIARTDAPALLVCSAHVPGYFRARVGAFAFDPAFTFPECDSGVLVDGDRCQQDRKSVV